MNTYFEANNSLHKVVGTDIRQGIEIIGRKYIGDNPEVPYSFRAYHKNGIKSDQKARFLFDFDKLISGEIGQYAMGFGVLRAFEKTNSTFVIHCMGPTKVYVNDRLVFTSSLENEHNFEEASYFDAPLLKGDNTFLIVSQKTRTGFGCLMGNTWPQWQPYNFMNPNVAGRSGCGGFIYSHAFDSHQIEMLPLTDASELMNITTIKWLPEPLKIKATIIDVSGLIESSRQGFLYAKTLAYASTDKDMADIKYSHCHGTKLYVNGELVNTLSGSGRISLPLKSGDNGLVVVFDINRDCQSELELIGTKTVSYKKPIEVDGYEGCWLVLGPLKSPIGMKLEELSNYNRVYNGIDGPTYFRTTDNHYTIRRYVESHLYGRWTYPLGVTLYGLLEASRVYDDDVMNQYVLNHIKQTVDIHEVALYEKEVYGYPGTNHQIAWLDALDDCGSFGALVLNAEGNGGADFNTDVLASRIATFMMEEQIRTETGAFYRGNETMWLDDLYMSIPFLARYYKKTGESTYLDECVRQMLLYKEKFYDETTSKLSHIYSTRYHCSNNINWGRGNGWCLLSLTELLAVMPKSYPSRQTLVAYYNDLVRYYLKHQNKSGLWHQIIDNPESYEETSVTAMMIVSMSRGIHNGYLSNELLKNIYEAIKNAWHGLMLYTVDREGNVYGVCRGSGYSFSELYYKNLGPRKNDTHGIGIILLAGCELDRCRDYLVN